MIEVNPNVVAPSQDFMKEKTVRFILRCIKNEEEDQLPPTPIVRKDESNQLVAIDGHNLLAVMAHLERPVQVHVAQNEEDGLPETNEANTIRNQDLRDKFESCLMYRDNAEEHGVSSFKDLIDKYSQLFEEIT